MCVIFSGRNCRPVFLCDLPQLPDEIISRMRPVEQPQGNGGCTGEDGLRYCGLCHEAKEAFFPKPLFSGLDRRVSAGKPLIVTTNLSLDKLKRPSDLERKRIYDRVLAVTVPVRFTGTSLRKEQRQEGYRWMKPLLSSERRPG